MEYINNNFIIDLSGLPKYTPVYARNKNDDDWIEDNFIRREKNGKYKTLKAIQHIYRLYTGVSILQR